MALRAKFKPTPEGEFHPGIPARDLDEDDYAALDNDQRALVRRSPPYDYRAERTQERDTPADRAVDKPAAAGEGKG